MPLKNAGIHIGNTTASFRSFFASSKSAMLSLKKHVRRSTPDSSLEGSWSRKENCLIKRKWPTVLGTESVPWNVCFWHSVRLHAQLSRITVIVRLCYSIGQLQLSEYTCLWENQIIGWSVSYPRAIGGAVCISTTGNRGWPLYVTSNHKLCLGIRERWRMKSETKLHLYTFCRWCTW